MNNPTDEPWPPPRKKKRSPTIRSTTVALAFLFQYYCYFQSNANVVIAWTPTTTTTTIHHHRRRPIRLWSKPSPQVDGSSSSSGSNVETRTKVETTSNSNNNNNNKKGRGKKGNKSNANNALSEQKTTTTTRIEEPCNVVFTHTNADFDTLAAAVALSLLWSKKEKPDYPTHVVLPRGVHPIVQRFLAFHKHLLPLRGFKTILPEDVYAVGVVDAQSAGRIGRGQSWLSTARSIHVFDHHDPHNNNNNNDDSVGNNNNNNPSLCEMATELVIDKVGSTTTILVERLKEAGIQPKPHEATLFVLGIRADTGGLVYESTTVRDAAALLWCLEMGASQSAISEFAMARIGSEQRTILNLALQKTKTNTIRGLRISAVLVGENDDDEDEGDEDDDTDKEYVAGLAQVCEELLDLTNSDVYILGATHQSGGGRRKKNKNKKSNDGKKENNKNKKAQWVSLIGRASPRAVGVNLNNIMHTFGGGGHPKAAAAAVRCDGEIIMGGPEEKNKQQQQQQDNDANGILQKAMTMIEMQIPEQLIASTFMVPIDQLITISAEESVTTARRIFEENDLKSAPVIDPQTNQFRGSLKYNDLIKAIRSGRQDDKVRGMLRSTVTTILPDTPQADLEELLIEKGVGRIPVVDDEGALVGLVTRTDVLRQHNLYENRELP
eukprot:scaffold4565_cov74-Cylindrotheca_fusiformis.AAC.6